MWRHHPRIATAWAVWRFIDPKATFEFVPRIKDFSSMDGIPFDIRGTELSHRHGRCILDALIAKYQLSDSALQRMAQVVRAADLPQEEAAPAIAAGF